MTEGRAEAPCRERGVPAAQPAGPLSGVAGPGQSAVPGKGWSLGLGQEACSRLWLPAVFSCDFARSASPR